MHVHILGSLKTDIGGWYFWSFKYLFWIDACSVQHFRASVPFTSPYSKWSWDRDIKKTQIQLSKAIRHIILLSSSTALDYASPGCIPRKAAPYACLGYIDLHLRMSCLYNELCWRHLRFLIDGSRFESSCMKLYMSVFIFILPLYAGSKVLSTSAWWGGNWCGMVRYPPVGLRPNNLSLPFFISNPIP